MSRPQKSPRQRMRSLALGGAGARWTLARKIDLCEAIARRYLTAEEARAKLDLSSDELSQWL